METPAPEISPFQGINVAPGADDDGWHPPPPVQLHDGTRIHLLKDGQALRAAFDAIARAGKRVCGEVYILRDDATGNEFADLFCHVARRGIDVNLIIDAFGSDVAAEKLFPKMKRAGVNVLPFHPHKPWQCKFAWRPWVRDHRKLLVVDDWVGGLGGLNIGDEYAGPWIAGKAACQKWLMRDNAIGVIGPAAQVLLRSFTRTWYYVVRGGPLSRPLLVHNLRVPPNPKGKRIGKQKRLSPPKRIPGIMLGDFGLFASVPTLASPTRPLLYAIIRNARSSLRMIMAYFAPDDELVDELCNAARRGVKVQLIFGALSDWKIMLIAARSFYARFLAAGIEIYERQGAVLHAKTLTVDDRLSMIGSLNLDYRSIEFNLELSGFIENAEFASQVNALLDHDISFSVRIDADHWHARTTRDRVVQWCVSRLRYLL